MATKSVYPAAKKFLSLLFALLSFIVTVAQTDVTRPEVRSVSPGNWAITINSGTIVTAVFSEAMNASTINGTSFELRNTFSNSLIPATVTYNASTKTATLYPSSTLTNALVYSAKVKGGSAGVKDLAGNAMANDYTWNFIVIPLVDLTPPTVLSVSPVNGATGVSKSASVTAVLSELLMPSTVSTSTVELRNAANVLIPATVTQDVANRIIKLTPAATLASSSLYKATIKGGSSGVKDASGNALPANYTWSFTTGTTGDITPPTVTSVMPSNSATGIAVNTSVSAVFSEVMTSSTITATTVQLSNSSNVLVTAAITYNDAARTVTLTPSATLSYSTVYTATITGGSSGVKDAAGNALASNYVWSFTTAAPPDVTAPTVTSVAPANGATGVAITTTVSAVFSEVLNAATISSSTFQLRNAANTLIAATVVYNASTNTVTLTPSALLSNSTVYTATITGGSAGVKDAAGNALANNYVWSFTTAAPPDVTPPTVTSVAPINGATGVPITTTVSAVFSEVLNATTISSSTFQLRNAANTLIAATVVYNASTNTATLTPSASLVNSTVYTATITGGSAGVKDLAGNALASNYVWSFTTAAPPDVTPPTVSSVTPLNAATGVPITTTVSAVFSEVLNAATVSSTTFQLRNAANTLIAATVVYNASTNTVTLSPSASLANSTVYTATITGGSSGVKDATGNALVSNYVWSFTTAAPPDVTPPTVTSVTPLNGATGVSITTSVSAVFSEVLTAATISSTTFQLRNAANTLIAVTVVYNASTNTATLTPSASLANSTVYTATITGGSAGVKDAAGNALASNYVWSFTTAAPPDVTPPTVTSVTPLNGATGVSITTSVSAVFSEVLTAATISSTTFQLRNAANTLIAVTVVYNASTNTATLTPSASLVNSTVYTATITGGSAGVKDAAGNALVNNYTWTFTTIAAVVTTYTIFQPTDVPAVPLTIDQAIEVGTKFRTTQNGIITGFRFYKGDGNAGTHTGHLWNSSGTQLAEAVFTNETASGWQQVQLAIPVAITTGTTYIVSYFSSAGNYAFTNYYFTSAIVNGPLRALADGEDGGNGLYTYTASPVFPTNSYLSSNYWIDVVFTASSGPDATPPVVNSVTPVNAATNVNTNTAVTGVFSEAVNATTVNSSTFELRNASNTLIPAAITYNASTNTATLTPTSLLAVSTVYTAKIKGGASGIKDIAGNAMINDYTWTFTIAAEPLLAPTEGPGGPILVISNTANPFSRYAVEILRAEGLNEFAASDISAVTSTVLNNYDVIILGEMTVTAAQVTMLTDWVNAGGTLIAFKSSSLLNSLMGLSAATTTLTDQYLLVNTASGPGLGIVNQTIQFHGAADLHTLSGATSLATLYSTAATATTNPAVTTRTVGANGGRAVAFTFDLAKSIIYTRQGNPAWAGQKRDGQIDPIRSDDLFFGGTSPDWIDFNKIAIPQADEQQRLLANIILQSNLHRKPLPRFWYLPRDLKAAIVMTGDDHANNGTEGRFNQYLSMGPNTAQDLVDWKAIRGTSYMYPGTPITNTQAVAFQSQGFELALHPTTECVNYTPSSLLNNFTVQLAQFASGYPGITAPVTSRTHCLAWSDWSSEPKTELQKGMRLDATYYYWPQAWMQNRPGMFTGSGMPMRFADLDGSLIDVYQAATQMTDETNMDYTAFCNAVLDKAIGAEGYYGIFTANMHTDFNPSAGSDAIIASALARQIPVISAAQMLTWLDSRNNSSFGNMTWSNNQLTFSVKVRSGAANIKAMQPFYTESGQLVSITLNGSPVTFTTQTIKGILYAFFAPAAGTNTYVATYSAVTRVANRSSEKSVTETAAQPSQQAASQKTAAADETSAARKLYVNVIPNPTTSYFNLVINSNDENPVTVRVTDIFGRVIEVHEKITYSTILRIGQSWTGGSYFAEVIQGDKRKVVKLIKAN